MRILLGHTYRYVLAFFRHPKNRKLNILLLLLWVGLSIQAILRLGSGASDFNMFIEPAIDARFFEKNPFEAWPGNSYTAFFYAVMSLFSPFAKWFAIVLWSLLNLCFYILSIAIVHQLLPTKFQHHNFYYWIAPLLLVFLFIDNIQLGQSNICMMFFVLVAIYYLHLQKVWKASAALGFAIAYKTTPLLFVFYLLLKGKIKAAFFSLCFSLIFMLVVPIFFYGPKASWTYFQDWSTKVLLPFAKGEDLKTRNIGYYHTNQSLEAFVNRHLTEYGAQEYGKIHAVVNPAFLSKEHAKLASNILKICIVLLLSAFVWLRRKKTSPQQLITEVSLFLSAILLLSPSSWVNHYILLLPAYIIAIHEFFKLPKKHWGRKLLLLGLVGSGCFMFLGLDVFMQSLSVYFLGMLVFLSCFLYYHFRT